MANDCRYRVPASWSWSPEPPAPVTGDDLRERIARAIYEEEHDGPWKNANHPDWVQSLRSADAVLAVLPPQPAPSPVPPWPGAVLSGCVDEDGVPTWLAQAGQVRGEQVRLMAGSEMWMTCSRGWSAIRWVEVRAPRAVPAPETERVPWWEARDRLGLAGDPFVEVGSDDEGPWVRVVEGGTKLHSPVAPDGTVEVLARDGDQ